MYYVVGSLADELCVWVPVCVCV